MTEADSPTGSSANLQPAELRRILEEAFSAYSPEELTSLDMLANWAFRGASSIATSELLSGALTGRTFNHADRLTLAVFITQYAKAREGYRALWDTASVIRQLAEAAELIVRSAGLSDEVVDLLRTEMPRSSNPLWGWVASAVLRKRQVFRHGSSRLVEAAERVLDES
jgi:hypothetical protein